MRQIMKTIFFSIILLLPFIVMSQNTMNVQWKFKTSKPIYAGVTADNDNLFVGSYDSTFYSLNASTGKLNWKFRTRGPIGSTAALDGDLVYFFSGDGLLYCLNKNTGTVKWQFKTLGGGLPDRRYDWPDYYQSSPTTDEQAVYFGAGDGRLYALNKSNGSIQWTFQTGDVIHTKPAVNDRKVIFGSFDGNLYCVNKTSGALLWKFKTTGQHYFPRGEINGSPVIHRNKVYVGSRDYNFYAIDLEAGFAHWLKTFPQGWALPVTPRDSVLYIGTSDDRVLIAVDAETGATQWRTNLSFNIFGGMALTKDYGYVGTLAGKIFKINLADGKILQTFITDAHKQSRSKYLKEDDNYVDNIGALLPNGNAMLQMYIDMGAIFSRPIVVREKIVFASNDGFVYAIIEGK
jgi:outer membrane protein assembly factor BamB